MQASALDNLPHDIRQRASAVFHLTVSYAFTMLKWTACEHLPADLDSSEVAASDANAHYVTMLFNDETHTYEQVSNLPFLIFLSSVTTAACFTWALFYVLDILPHMTHANGVGQFISM